MTRTLRRLWVFLTNPPLGVLPPPDRSVKRQGQILDELWRHRARLSRQS
jgi:hypothetical protein